MRHRNPVTAQFLCRTVQFGNATQLLCSMNGPNLKYMIYMYLNKNSTVKTTLKKNKVSES